MDATQNDSLTKRLRNTESKHRINDECRIKFVSKSGIKLKDVLKRKHILGKPCSDNDGKSCVNSNGEPIKRSECRKNRVSYMCKCKTCGVAG